MNKEIINVKMSAERFKELYRLYDGLYFNYEPENLTELILRAHITELHGVLCRMIEKEQKNYTVSFGGLAATAFIVMWEDSLKNLAPLARLVVQAVFNELDRMVKRPPKAPMQLYDARFL